MKCASPLFLVAIIFLFSCKSEEEKRNEKTLVAIKSYMSDVCFKRNLSLNIIDIRINRTEIESVDSAYSKIIKEAYFKAFYTLGQTEPEKQYDDYWIRKTANEDPTNIKLKNLRKNYNGLENWYWLHAYVKATQTDQQGIKDNILLDNVWFLIDENYYILNSGFKCK